MAYGETYPADTDGLDAHPAYTYAPKTAQQAAFITELEGQDALKLEDQARAEAAGVSSVTYIDYAEALENYESRSDAELLINRRARENAVDFNEQDFARQRVQEAAATQSSTVGSTTVVFGDDFTDVAGGGDPDGAGPLTDSPDGQDDTVVQPDRT